MIKQNKFQKNKVSYREMQKNNQLDKYGQEGKMEEDKNDGRDNTN